MHRLFTNLTNKNHENIVNTTYEHVYPCVIKSTEQINDCQSIDNRLEIGCLHVTQAIVKVRRFRVLMSQSIRRSTGFSVRQSIFFTRDRTGKFEKSSIDIPWKTNIWWAKCQGNYIFSRVIISIKFVSWVSSNWRFWSKKLDNLSIKNVQGNFSHGNVVQLTTGKWLKLIYENKQIVIKHTR